MSTVEYFAIKTVGHFVHWVEDFLPSVVAWRSERTRTVMGQLCDPVSLLCSSSAFCSHQSFSAFHVFFWTSALSSLCISASCADPGWVPTACRHLSFLEAGPQALRCYQQTSPGSSSQSKTVSFAELVRVPFNNSQWSEMVVVSVVPICIRRDVMSFWNTSCTDWSVSCWRLQFRATFAFLATVLHG